MKVKCTNPKLNYIVFPKNEPPRRVKVGETFEVKKVPAKWAGLVEVVDGSKEAETPKTAVTNPAKDDADEGKSTSKGSSIPPKK